MNLQNNKPQPVYDCTQQELYAIARLMWASCLENEADFAALKPKYTAVFINGKVAEVAAAEMLPDADARTEPAKTARAILVQKGTVCLENWQSLKRYIFTAYKADKTVLDAKLSAAGANYYSTASHENWEDLKGLVNSGSGFITGHTAALLADDNMPVGFPAQFETDRNLFITTYDLFKDKEQDKEEGTTDKIETNNTVYEDMMEMAADGVHIYRKQAAKRERFVWVKVKELVSSEPGGGGGGGAIQPLTFSGTVTDNVTGMFLADASLESDGEVIATTNILGQFSITFPITEVLNVQLTIKKAGYDDYVTPIQFSPGTDLEQNFTMQRKVLATYQPTLGAGIHNVGAFPANATGLRMTLLDGTSVTVGLSNNGMSFTGNTETLTNIDEVVDRTLDELGGYAAMVLVQNNSGGDVEVKVEVLG